MTEMTNSAGSQNQGRLATSSTADSKALSWSSPALRIRSGRIYSGGRMLDLSRRPMVLKVFQAFVKAQGHEVARDDLVSLVYGELGAGERSLRLQESLSHNVVKLISRARELAEAAFGGPGSPFDWFLYQPQRQVWSLYRLRNEFVAWPALRAGREGERSRSALC